MGNKINVTEPKAERLAREPSRDIDLRPPTCRPVKAYQAHYQDVVKRTGADLSRVDLMIAIRMQITGHQE